MAPGQADFDGGLALEQPVHGEVQVVVGDGAEAAGGGQLGAGLGDAGHDQGAGEVAVAGGLRVEEGVEAQLAEGAKGRGDKPVGLGAEDGEGVGEIGDSGAALEEGAEALNEVFGPLGEVEDGVFADLASWR